MDLALIAGKHFPPLVEICRIGSVHIHGAIFIWSNVHSYLLSILTNRTLIHPNAMGHSDRGDGN